MENKQYVIIIAICLMILGMIIGLTIAYCNQPSCGKITLTEEEISRKFTEWLNDNVEVTIKIVPQETTDWGYVVDPEINLMEELP